MKNPQLTYLSLGWGVQSWTLAAMVALGELPPVDLAIHADTTHEAAGTYAHAAKWTPWLEKPGGKGGHGNGRQHRGSAGMVRVPFGDDSRLHLGRKRFQWTGKPTMHWPLEGDEGRGRPGLATGGSRGRGGEGPSPRPSIIRSFSEAAIGPGGQNPRGPGGQATFNGPALRRRGLFCLTHPAEVSL